MRRVMSSAIGQTNHVVGPCMEFNKITCTVWTGNGGPPVSQELSMGPKFSEQPHFE
jgi:hypothetical protein